MPIGVQMSLNWREIELVLEELPLQGSSLQQTLQHDFHSMSWNFYHPQVGRWTLYTEVGTPYSRMHLLSESITTTQQGKTAKLQRFIQFCRANLEGSKVVGVSQQSYDRLVQITLENHGRTMYLYLRFYSGPGANIIVTDEQGEILDLLYRRPNRKESSGEFFSLPEPRQTEDKPYPVRPRKEGSFNRQIEEEYGQRTNEETLAELRRKVMLKRDRQLRILETTLTSHQTTLLATQDYERFHALGDLLSANQYRMGNNLSEIEVEDWETGKNITIALDVKLKANENIQLYYEKYQKAKGSYENALSEVKRSQEAFDAEKRRFDQLLGEERDERQSIRLFKRELEDNKAVETAKVHSPGLTIQSGHFTLLVGRNAKENDELLRHWVRGNDYWMHTRDVPGGYVFIKFMKGKTVPLEVLLDAANLAVVFSKAKKERKADLYYTQVKYLRRAKGGKTGLVLPTQEKNLSVVLDDARLSRLLLEDEDA